MKYFIVTYGCQANYADSERIARRLENSGHTKTEQIAKANLVVINACSVRQSAMHRVYSKINKFREKKIILTGCVLPADRKKLKNKVAEIWHPDEYFDPPAGGPIYSNPFSANVPIMSGCNNFCSYCAVPFTRGREKSRPAAEIIAEVKNLVAKGCKEIWLLGQNVNSYCNKTKETENAFFNSLSLKFSLRENFARPRLELKNAFSVSFSVLLRLISVIPGEFKINFLTSHPKDMSDELIKTMASCEKLSKETHLPMQSGDIRILKKMNRHYTPAHYKNLIKKIRRKMHGVKISTDIIVGFPGETKKQFQNTLKLIKDIEFDMIYFAQYSPRPGTAAAKLVDDVLPQEKKRRAETVNNLLRKIAADINKKYLGKIIPVLICEIKKDFAIGKTATNKDVKLPKAGLSCGDLIRVKITKTSAWGLGGK